MALPFVNPCDYGDSEPCGVNPSFVYTRYPCDFDDPRAIDSRGLPIIVDNRTSVKAEVVNRQRESILAIEAELGIKPSGTFTTVRARLDELESLLCAIWENLQETGSSVNVLFNGTEVVLGVKNINFTGGVNVTSDDANSVTVTVSGSNTIMHQEVFAASSAQTVFYLSYTPIDQQSTELFIDGISQTIGTDYIVSGLTVTYSGIPPLTGDEEVVIKYFEDLSIIQNPGLSDVLVVSNSTDGYDIDFGNTTRGINVLDPINNQDIATKAYVDEYTPSWHRTVIDFRLLDTQTIAEYDATDTTVSVTLSGQTIQCWHPGGFHTSAPFGARIVNGEGLQIGSGTQTGVSYNDYQRITIPRIVWPFTNVPRIGLETPIRAGILMEDSARVNHTTQIGNVRVAIAWQDLLNSPTLGTGKLGMWRGATAKISSGYDMVFPANTVALGSVYWWAESLWNINVGYQVNGVYGWSGLLGVGCRLGAAEMDSGIELYADIRETPTLDFGFPATGPLSSGHWNFQVVSRDYLQPLTEAIDPANWGVEITWNPGDETDYYNKYTTIAGLVIEAFY